MLLETTALPNLILVEYPPFKETDSRDEYQIAVDNLSFEEQSELRALVPWFRKTVFIICYKLKQTPAEEPIELKELTLTFPNVPSPCVQALLVHTFSEEIGRVVAEHNASAALLQLESNSVTIH